MSKGTNDKTLIKTMKLITSSSADVDWKDRKNKQLIAGILKLKTPDEVGLFLRDIMTPKEIKEFSNRLEAASLLSSQVQYNAINEMTGLSSATIARIAKWLGGSGGGYRLVLSRLNTSTWHHSSSQIRKGFSLN